VVRAVRDIGSLTHDDGRRQRWHPSWQLRRWLPKTARTALTPVAILQAGGTPEDIGILLRAVGEGFTVVGEGEEALLPRAPTALPEGLADVAAFRRPGCSQRDAVVVDPGEVTERAGRESAGRDAHVELFAEGHLTSGPQVTVEGPTIPCEDHLP